MKNIFIIIIILSCISCSKAKAVDIEKLDQTCYKMCFNNYKGTRAWYNSYQALCTCEIDQKPYLFQVPINGNKIKNKE